MIQRVKRGKSLVSVFGSLMLLIILFSCSNDKDIFSENIAVETKKIGDSGSNRATAYLDSNKIIETEDMIHFFWLDFFEGQFWVMGITYDKNESQWGEKIFISNEVWDNHGGPGVVIDNAGIIHMFFGPHSRPMKYVRTKNANSIEQWTEVEEIGNYMTYPTAIIDESNTIYLFARKYDGLLAVNEVTSIQLLKLENGQWSQPQDLVIPNYSQWKAEGKKLNFSQQGYARWAHTAKIGQDNRIHLVYMNFEYLPEDLVTNYQNFRGGASYYVGYMYSDDGGETWMTENKPVDLPATPQTAEVIIGQREPAEEGFYYNISNLALDVHGQPTLVISERSHDSPTRILLAQKSEGDWGLTPIFSESADYRYNAMALAIDNQNNIFIADSKYSAANACNCNEDWGTKYLKTSISVSGDNGTSFENIYTSDFEEGGPVWFPNFQNTPLGDNYPSLLLTVGNSAEESTNSVYAVRMIDKIKTF